MAAIILITVSLALALRFGFMGRTDRLLDMGIIRNYRTSDAIWYGLGIVLLTLVQAFALIRSRRDAAFLSTRLAFGAGLLAACAFVPMYPVTAIDIFNYASQSRVWTDLGSNPNVVAPSVLPASDWTRFSGEWVVRPSPYGPLWRWISSPATALSGDNLILAVILLKISMLIALAGAAWLIGDIVERRGGNRAFGIIATLWSPLLLWEGIGNGHNDMAMGAFLIAAIWFWQRGNQQGTVPMVVAAALVKYTVVLVAPVIALGSWLKEKQEERGRTTLWWLIDSALIVIIGFWPFYAIRPILDMAKSQANITLTSPLWLTQRQLADRWAADDVAGIFKPIALGLLAVVMIWQLWVVCRKPDRMIGAVVATMTGYFLLTSWQFRGWYLIPVVLVAAASNDVRWISRLAIWGFCSLGAYWLYIWAVPKFHWTPDEAIQAGTVLTFVPIVTLVMLDLILDSLEALRHPRQRSAALAVDVVGDESS